MISWLIVFVAAALLDVVYVGWMSAVGKNQTARAVACSMLLGCFGMIGTISAVENHGLAIPYLLGLGVGTAVGMRVTKREG